MYQEVSLGANDRDVDVHVVNSCGRYACHVVIFAGADWCSPVYTPQISAMREPERRRPMRPFTWDPTHLCFRDPQEGTSRPVGRSRRDKREPDVRPPAPRTGYACQRGQIDQALDKILNPSKGDPRGLVSTGTAGASPSRLPPRRSARVRRTTEAPDQDATTATRQTHRRAPRREAQVRTPRQRGMWRGALTVTRTGQAPIEPKQLVEFVPYSPLRVVEIGPADNAR